jgi:hypothetical protein
VRDRQQRDPRGTGEKQRTGFMAVPPALRPCRAEWSDHRSSPGAAKVSLRLTQRGWSIGVPRGDRSAERWELERTIRRWRQRRRETERPLRRGEKGRGAVDFGHVGGEGLVDTFV